MGEARPSVRPMAGEARPPNNSRVRAERAPVKRRPRYVPPYYGDRVQRGPSSRMGSEDVRPSQRTSAGAARPPTKGPKANTVGAERPPKRPPVGAERPPKPVRSKAPATSPLISPGMAGAGRNRQGKGQSEDGEKNRRPNHPNYWQALQKNGRRRSERREDRTPEDASSRRNPRQSQRVQRQKNPSGRRERLTRETAAIPPRMELCLKQASLKSGRHAMQDRCRTPSMERRPAK